MGQRLLNSRVLIAAVLLGLPLLGFLVADSVARTLIFELSIAGKERVGRKEGGRYAVNDLLDVDRERIESAAVLFLDSTNDSVPPGDPDQRTISAIMGDELKPFEIEGYGVSFPGAGVDWIVTLLNYWTERVPELDYAVLPLNLRWISPAWRGMDLTDNARKPLEYYVSERRLFPWLLDIGYRSPKVRADRLSSEAETVIGAVPLDIAQLDAGDLAEQLSITSTKAKQRIFRMRFALAYGHHLIPDDPLFDLIDRAEAICRERELHCLFFIPPFNFERMREIAPEVASVLETNVGLVRRYFQERQSQLLDLSETLPNDRFHDVVNEHVNWLGRRNIGKCIALALVEPNASWNEPIDCGPH